MLSIDDKPIGNGVKERDRVNLLQRLRRLTDVPKDDRRTLKSRTEPNLASALKELPKVAAEIEATGRAATEELAIWLARRLVFSRGKVPLGLFTRLTDFRNTAVDCLAVPSVPFAWLLPALATFFIRLIEAVVIGAALKLSTLCTEKEELCCPATAGE